MRISRRDFLAGAGSSACLGILPAAATMALADDGFVELTAGPSLQKIYKESGPASSLWTYNGGVPGPEIRVKRGERVKVRLINQLEEPTSIHWHGVRIDNAMDGVSGLTQDAVPPGEAFEYDFVAPDAGTYWYHAHNKSWQQVGRGLYGPLIVEEEDPAFGLDQDLTLILDDWRLDREGALDLESFGSLMDWSHAGRLGNWLTVNGVSLPRFDLVAGAAHRVRLINASNARVLELDLSDLGGRLIALDGQPLKEAMDVPSGGFLMGPGQRADLVVVPAEGRELALREISGADPFDVARFVILLEGNVRASYPTLMANALPEPDLTSARMLALDMTGGAMGQMAGMTHGGEPLTRERMRETGQLWGLNGVAGLPKEPFFRASSGETVLLEIVNDTAFPHAMHTHGHHFRIVEQSRAMVEDTGAFRDTVLVAAGETVRIAFVADNPGKWLLHCHMLEHAAAGMMTWFEVL
ncbi:multicopper oxidase family protein [Roseibium polysiphoniae]|uniref:multicopper oxidase family protein n=1 Tax=Roseibium polysiphoniae TaxID=2571221 RepID=UPI0032976B20